MGKVEAFVGGTAKDVSVDGFWCDTIKYTAGQCTPVRDLVATEAPLQININRRAFSMTMRTPGHDRELVRGLLFTEGILSRTAHFAYTEEISDSPPGMITAHVQLAGEWSNTDAQSRSLLASAACGICGKTAWDDTALMAPPISATAPLDISRLPHMAEAMQTRQDLFHASGGTHAAAAFAEDGELLSLHEDVGRHNAVDKVVGELLAADTLGGVHCLFVSGRVSYEIIAKTCRAEIAHLVAISAPTSLAVTMARRMGITLIGFARGDAATVYAQPQQILNAEGRSDV